MRTNENGAGMVFIALAITAAAMGWWTGTALASSDLFSPISEKAHGRFRGDNVFSRINMISDILHGKEQVCGIRWVVCRS